jgi:GAF domain-containing protein
MIWDAERERRERLAQLEGFLAKLPVSLDIREVLKQVSDAVGPVIPHHFLTLTELDERLPAFQLIAFAGECDAPAPERPVSLTKEEARRQVDFEIVRDLPSELSPDSERNRLLLSMGMRSWLRVPVLLEGRVHGMISFYHREPERYGSSDLEVTRRIADRVGSRARRAARGDRGNAGAGHERRGRKAGGGGVLRVA